MSLTIEKSFKSSERQHFQHLFVPRTQKPGSRRNEYSLIIPKMCTDNEFEYISCFVIVEKKRGMGNLGRKESIKKKNLFLK